MFFEIVRVRNEDILKKNVVLSSEGLVWTTTQAITAGSHSDTTMNIVRYNKVQWARQRVPSIAITDRRLSQRAILWLNLYEKDNPNERAAQRTF